MQTARRVFWNATVLFGADVARLIIGTALTILIARTLGSAELGKLTYVMTLVGMLGVIGDFGLTAYYVREAQQHPEPQLTGAFIGVRLVTGMAVVFMLVLHAFISQDRSMSVLLVLGSALLAFGIWPSVTTALLRAREMMVYEGATKVLGALASTAGGIAMVLAGRGIVGATAAMVAVAAATTAIHVWLGRRLLPGGIRLRQPRVVYRTLLRGAWPFASLAVLVIIYFRIDSLMLSWLRGNSALGQYSAAYRLMEAVLLIPLTLAGASLPAVARALPGRTDEVIAASVRAIHFLAILAVPGAAFGALYAGPIFLALYGPQYAEASRIFQILAFTLIAVFTSSITSGLITAGPRPAVNTYIAAVMVVLNVALNAVLIPRYSGVGAAAATVTTETAGLVLGTLYIRKAIGPLAFAQEFVRPVLACLTVAMVASRYVSLFTLPLALGAYLVLLWMMRGISSDDVSFLQRLLRRPAAALLSGGRL